MDLIEGIKTWIMPYGIFTLFLLWEMDLIEGIKTGDRYEPDRRQVGPLLWEMDLIEGIKTVGRPFSRFRGRPSGYEKWTW